MRREASSLLRPPPVSTADGLQDEAAFWLNRLHKARVTGGIAIEPLLAEAEELARIFAAAARTARQRRGTGQSTSSRCK